MTIPSQDATGAGPDGGLAAVPSPPVTRREAVVEHLHGHDVADPYRWLEATGADEVGAWARAQNAAARHHLDALPRRDELRERLARLWDHERRGAPRRHGEVWLQHRHAGLEDQPVLWAAPASGELRPDDGAWRVLLDPNALAGDGTTALVDTAVTEDGSLLAYAISQAGSDWMTWRVREVATGRDLPDEVPWAKFAGAAWLSDRSGFLYGAYDPPPAGEEHAAAMRDHRLRLHRLGTSSVEDPVVHARPDEPEWGFSPAITHDGRWLVVHVFHGTEPRNRIHLARVEGSEVGEIEPWLDAADAHYEVLGALDDRLLVLTDLDAPHRRILAIDPADPTRRAEVVAEDGQARLEDAALVGGDTRDGGPWEAWLVCHHLVDAVSRLTVHDARTGEADHTVDVGLGSVRSIAGGRRQRSAHLLVESFTTPGEVLTHDLDAATTSTHFSPELPAPDRPVVTEQVHVHHDDVAVPLFLVHREDVEPTGEVATVLWGYGGFDIPVTPMFQPAWRAWVDAGGLLAVACLRGGGEYGRAWHDDGRRHNKQHVFDDALACADWLSGADDRPRATTPQGAPRAEVWTRAAHLGIEGRSNGGALVGACITQRPGAFGSAVGEVGVLDLLRFHRWTIGWAWVSDYGSPDDPADLATLLAWSPYHNVHPDRAYPPTLLTTGDTDDRVVPAHSYKMAAALQHAQAEAARAGVPGAQAPVLLRIDLSAGHGAGKPVGKLLDERADVLAFHAHHLGLDLAELGLDRAGSPRTGR